MKLVMWTLLLFILAILIWLFAAYPLFTLIVFLLTVTAIRLMMEVFELEVKA